MDANDLLGRYATKSYAQEGEDILLRELFLGKKMGFYIDIGAYHPKQFSNTYWFYRQGWRGINIDATPGSMRLFNIFRRDDINLEKAISNGVEDLTFYRFEIPALNTFDNKRADFLVNQHYKLKSTCNVKTSTLANILNIHLPRQQEIDFMSIDVEGFDYNVLLSNDWIQYKPKCIVVECLGSHIAEMEKQSLYIFLHDKNYTLVAKTLRTCFFWHHE